MKRYIPDEVLKEFRPHNLRKTKLTALMREDKCDIAFVAKYARHADINNTMTYVGYDADEVTNKLLNKQP